VNNALSIQNHEFATKTMFQKSWFPLLTIVFACSLLAVNRLLVLVVGSCAPKARLSFQLHCVPSKVPGNQPFCRVRLMSCVTVRASLPDIAPTGMEGCSSSYSQIRTCAVTAHCLVNQASVHEKELERIEQRSHHSEGSLVSTQDGSKDVKGISPQERRPPYVWGGGGSAVTDFSWK
jgi:hypothetical protein